MRRIIIGRCSKFTIHGRKTQPKTNHLLGGPHPGSGHLPGCDDPCFRAINQCGGEIPDDEWMVADIYGAVARISVPLFFMMSSYLLLSRSESLRIFFTKRMTRVLIPFLAWSFIYLFWFCGNHANACTTNVVTQLLLVKGTYYHLWYLYSLISIYFIIPVLHLMFRREPDKKVLWYLMGLWLIFQPVLTITRQAWNFNINISAPLANGFLCFFILGYLLGEIALSRSRIILSIVLWVSGGVVTFAGTYLLTRSSHRSRQV